MRLTHYIASLCLGGAAILATAWTVEAQQKQITVANFGGLVQDMVREIYFNPFAATGVKLVEDSRDYGIGVVRTRIEGGNNTWDVVAAEDIEVIQGCQEKLFEKIDYSKIKDADKLIADAKLDCGVGEILYNMSIAYDPAKTPEAPQSWADFWDIKKWPGKRALYRDPRDSLEAALLADGVAAGDVYKVLATPEGQDRAFAKIKELLPNIIWYTNPGQSRQMLASGEAAMIATYDSGINATNLNAGLKNKVVNNNSIRHIDYWAIPKGTPNLDTAYDFLNFATDAGRQAELASKMGISVPNTDAIAKVDPKVLPVLSANPDNIKTAIQSDAQFWLDNYDALSQRFTTLIGK
ncbi:ABC transporter substrate-binding protein [Mesorhizobium sp. WSM4976]|uniref:ABC transporter substrate-binding protein n=1 Tax=Mesorhizobium sp. WSM4976 TaxID=3038549 RepID=UPI0024172FF4|nr:ABC transporter substrate-binding protein [Mesorhizobium sp. WSM4976]MDG4898559.1 ABC transporter substrate-binding protein [Mesorhizobium sp. WSM4976]